MLVLEGRYLLEVKGFFGVCLHLACGMGVENSEIMSKFRELLSVLCRVAMCSPFVLWSRGSLKEFHIEFSGCLSLLIFLKLTVSDVYKSLESAREHEEKRIGP